MSFGTLVEQLVGTVAVAFGQYWGYYLIIDAAIRGNVEARKNARRAAARQKAEYNASLQDRFVTLSRANPPGHVGYGRCIKGGEIVDQFSTDKTAVAEDGTTYTKADGYKHLVVLLASHPSQAIHEIYLDGVPLGSRDASGWVTGGEFYKGRNATRVVSFTGSLVLGETPISIVTAYSAGASPEDPPQPQSVSIVGNTLVGPGGILVTVTYLAHADLPAVRASVHLGSSTEPVDAYLASVAPTRYTSAHGLRGITAVVLTLDLEDPRFQGGPPNITADGSWALVLDPRTGLSAWSDNPALCIRDFLTQPYGFNADADEVNAAKLIAAADACDATISLIVGASTTSGKRYTCNGAFTTEASAEAVLEDLAECMAGTVVYGADWQVNAGVWTAPVLTLADDDLRGPLEVVQADTGMDELFNGLRGQYAPAAGQSPTDINPPYQNAVFVAADGDKLWHDIELPFTNDPARARNLARIFTEKVRAGQVLRYPAKLRAWGLQVGERITLNNATFGIVAQTYRVTDWQADAPGGPTLLLQRDYASIWDLADAAAALPEPNTHLPNPWVAPAIAGLAATSGTTTLLRTRDGTIVPRILVSWTAVTDAYVLDGGYVDVQFRRNASAWQRLPPVPANLSSAWVADVQEGDQVVLEVAAVNKYRVRGAPSHLGHAVVGKGALPANVAGLSATLTVGGVRVAWTPCADLDYKETEVRVGASYAGGSTIFRGAGAYGVWLWPAAGSYTVWAVHRDTSGNTSATPASTAVTVTSAISDPAIAAALAAAIAAQATADGKIDTFWQTSAPSGASEGDLWFDTDDGFKQYRRTSGAWVVAADTRIGQAIIDAAGAQATADGKVVTFVQTSAPGASAVGDLWLDSDDGNKLYRWSGAAWVALPVGTGGLAPAAATEIFSDTYDFAGATTSSGVGGTARTWTITPTAACEIELTFKLLASGLNGDAGNRVRWKITPSGGSTTTLDEAADATGAKLQFSGHATFTAAAGVALDVEIATVRSGGTIALFTSYMRATCIKR